MLEVIAHVVADERQHGHRVVAEGTDLRLSSGGGLAGGQRGANEGRVLPVDSLGHQRHSVGATSTEQDRVDRHPLRIVELGRGDRALFDWHAVPGVRVRGQAVLVGSPVLALPVDQVVWLVFEAFPPDVAIVGQRNVGEDVVPQLHRLHGVGVGLVVRSGGDAEEAVFWVDGVEPTVVAEVEPGDVVANDLGLPTGDRRLDHREVGLTALGREGGANVVGLALGRDELKDQHVLCHPAFVPGHDRCDAEGVALLRQDGVAAVAGAVGPDHSVLRELRNVLRFVARPLDVLLARLQWGTY